MDQVVEGDFTPNIIYRDNEPVEYAVLPLTQYGSEYHSETFPTVSSMLETYYASRDTLTRIRQKSSDLRRIVQTALERNRKKYALQQKQMKDTPRRTNTKSTANSQYLRLRPGRGLQIFQSPELLHQ